MLGSFIFSPYNPTQNSAQHAVRQKQTLTLLINSYTPLIIGLGFLGFNIIFNVSLMIILGFNN